MILHQFPMYIRYSFAWYGWYSPKIDRGTHIFLTRLSSIPGKRDPLCRLVSCMSVSRATIIVLSSVFDAHHHQTYIDHEYSA